MRKVNYMLACFMAAATLATGFTACSSDDDPNYNPPTIGMSGNDAATNAGMVDLSDNLTFELPVNITSEAGLASIVVKDGTGKEWLNQTTFANPNSVQSVTLDLSSLTESTQLYLTVVATAKDGKVTTSTQLYSLTVNVPQLYVRMNPVSTVTDEATVDVIIGRGVKALSKAIVYKGTEMFSEISLADAAKDKKVLESVNVTGLVNGNNEIKVEVYEEGMNEASASETVNVIKIDLNNVLAFNMETGEMINWFEGDLITYSIQLNLPESITFEKSIAAGGYAENTWNFVYDESGKHITEINQEIYEMSVDENWNMTENSYNQSYKFTYNEYNELVKVTFNDEDYVTDVVYGVNGIESYKVNGKEYHPQYTDGVRVDCLDANMSGSKFVYDGSEAINPYYLSALPAVIPGDDEATDIPLQILYSQYLFNSIEGGWNGGWTTGTYNDMYPTYEATANKGDKEWKFQIIFKN